MTKIKIAYRQVIDSRSSSDFEKKLFNDSFNEFYLQSQAYSEGGRLKTFQDLIVIIQRRIRFTIKLVFQWAAISRN